MKKKSKGFFERFAVKVTKATGHPAAFILACIVILVWGVTGPIFKYSDTWQLVINTGTTIVTFLMVFIIQHSQNKDTVAIHLKIKRTDRSEQRCQQPPDRFRRSYRQGVGGDQKILYPSG